MLLGTCELGPIEVRLSGFRRSYENSIVTPLVTETVVYLVGSPVEKPFCKVAQRQCLQT